MCPRLGPAPARFSRGVRGAPVKARKSPLGRDAKEHHGAGSISHQRSSPQQSSLSFNLTYEPGLLDAAARLTRVESRGGGVRTID